MTVGELRKLLETAPDDVTIYLATLTEMQMIPVDNEQIAYLPSIGMLVVHI